MKIARSVSSKLALSVLVVLGCFSAHAEDNTVVAVLGSNSFLSKDFYSITTASVARVVGLVSSTNDAMDSLAAKKAKRLADWVLNIAMNESARNLGISVSPEEQQITLKKIYRDDDKVLNDLGGAMTKLPIALREAHTRPNREREIYMKYLANFMSYETWRGHVGRYDSEAKIASLEKMTKPTKADLYKPMPLLEKMLLEKKIRERVIVNASVPESCVRDEYARLYPAESKRYDEVRDSIQTELLKVEKERIWKLWLAETIRSAKVVIYDQSVDHAYKKLLEELPKRSVVNEIESGFR